jgi:hypothetical protein
MELHVDWLEPLLPLIPDLCSHVVGHRKVSEMVQ